VVEAAAGTDCSVYGFLQAYINQEEALHPTSEQMRAAAANFWAKGVDGLYSYFAQQAATISLASGLQIFKMPARSLLTGSHTATRRGDG